MGVEREELQPLGLREGDGHRQGARHLHHRAGTDTLEGGRLPGFEHHAPEGHDWRRDLALPDIGALEELEAKRSPVRCQGAGLWSWLPRGQQVTAVGGPAQVQQQLAAHGVGEDVVEPDRDSAEQWRRPATQALGLRRTGDPGQRRPRRDSRT
ncbi:hypothetical protein GCM10010299_25940 [Streptomyces tanashiensis]|nr:hypothetical protein GCM10010299_25940 [Streptomyces tanashiensis]